MARLETLNRGAVQIYYCSTIIYNILFSFRRRFSYKYSEIKFDFPILFAQVSILLKRVEVPIK